MDKGSIDYDRVLQKALRLWLALVVVIIACVLGSLLYAIGIAAAIDMLMLFAVFLAAVYAVYRAMGYLIGESEDD